MKCVCVEVNEHILELILCNFLIFDFLKKLFEKSINLAFTLYDAGQTVIKDFTIY